MAPSDKYRTKQAKPILKSRAIKKEQILLGLEEAVRWVNDYEAGKIKAKTIEELLAEL